MMKNVSLVVLFLSFVALSSGESVAETLVIPGSGNPEYILRELADQFNRIQDQHDVVVPQTIGTAGAIRAISEGTASLARVGRPLKDSEKAGGIVYSPLGRDPVVFVAGAGVSVGIVELGRILDVYLGKLTNWSELGGAQGMIRAIGREVTDASRQAIGRGVKVFADMKFAENIKVVHLDWQMLELLDRFPTSIGFLNRSALMAAKTKLVILKLESMEMNPESVGSGRYPFLIDFGLIYKEDALTPAGREFLKFVKSKEGELVMREHGVVPASAVH